MSAWETPVIDREEANIENKTYKAYLNAEDLNRIEGDIEYLYETLGPQHYRIGAIAPPKNWKSERIPTTKDIDDLCNNIKAITKAYYEPDGYYEYELELPNKLNIEHINYVEKILQGIYDLLVVRGISYNTWGFLKTYTYEYLHGCEYTYEKLKKGLNFPDFLYDVEIEQN